MKSYHKIAPVLSQEKNKQSKHKERKARQNGREPFCACVRVCVCAGGGGLKVFDHSKQIYGGKVKKTAALIMQIFFIWAVITTDRAPQGAVTDVSLWLEMSAQRWAPSWLLCDTPGPNFSTKHRDQHLFSHYWCVITVLSPHGGFELLVDGWRRAKAAFNETWGIYLKRAAQL